MERPEIHNYQNPREYLIAWLDFQKTTEDGFNVRKWAKKLGYNTPGYLSNILCGKRNVTINFANKVSDQLELNNHEKNTLNLLVNYTNSSGNEAKEFYATQLQAQDPKIKFDQLELDKFQMIKDWYHIPILQMVTMPEFVEDYKIIAARLGSIISPQTVEIAIHRMLRLGYLKRDENKQLYKVNQNSLFIGEEVSNQAIKAYHAMQLKLSDRAIKRLPVQSRDFSATTLPIKKDNIEKLKILIKDFQTRVHQLCENNEADSLFQVNVQAFDLLDDKVGNVQ